MLGFNEFDSLQYSYSSWTLCSNSKKDRRLKYQGIYSRARRSAISTVQAKPRWNWGIHICSVTTKNPIPASEIILRLSAIKPDEFQIDKSATAS